MFHTKTVLRKYYDEQDGPGDELGGGVTYLSPRHVLVLDSTHAGDLGNPDEITVTIEPGDTTD